jgi:hypothetical protein
LRSSLNGCVQYALGDFAVRQAAIALGKSSDDVALYANRSMNFVNMWNPNVTSDGFKGFAQRRFPVRVSFMEGSMMFLSRVFRTAHLLLVLQMLAPLLIQPHTHVQEEMIMTLDFTNVS